SKGKSRSAGAQEPECILKYMRIPSTAGTRGSERSRFFHKLSGTALNTPQGARRAGEDPFRSSSELAMEAANPIFRLP
ncbi:MAG: hypothetical protein ACREYC_07465, partial [Gammaproteobacteria bacterium]